MTQAMQPESERGHQKRWRVSAPGTSQKMTADSMLAIINAPAKDSDHEDFARAVSMRNARC